MADNQQIRKHGAYDHMPSGADALPWAGDPLNGVDGIHMQGVVADMPDPSLGTQSGSDGAVTGTAFTSASGHFTAANTGDTILLVDTGATTPVVYTFTVTFVSTTALTLSSAWAGTGTTVLPWTLSGSGPSNKGMLYHATDGTDSPTGTLYRSDGTQWTPIGGLSSGCSPFTPWIDWGPTSVDVSVVSSGGCATSSPPSSQIKGLVWSCGSDDPTTATSMITGRVTISLSSNGSVNDSGCSPGDLQAYCYSFLPSFWQASENMGFILDKVSPFGFGITFDAVTSTVLPAWLVYNDTLDAWVVKVAGTDITGMSVSANLARPPTDSGAPAYPFEYGAGLGQSLLFSGTFLYFVQIGD